MNRLRVIKAAAALDRRFSNPDVAAINRAKRTMRPTIRAFWVTVSHALYRPAYCQSWTNDDMRNWAQIRAVQHGR